MTDETKDLLTCASEFKVLFGTSGYMNSFVATAICVFAYAFIVGMQKVSNAIARIGK